MDKEKTLFTGYSNSKTLEEKQCQTTTSETHDCLVKVPWPDASHEKWRKWLQPDSVPVGGQCHIISQQTSSKQEEQKHQACFQGSAKLPPGDWWLLFYGETSFLSLSRSFLPHSNNNHRAEADQRGGHVVTFRTEDGYDWQKCFLPA